MDFEFFSFFEWRDVLLAIVLLLAAYVLVALLRMRRLKGGADRKEILGALAAHSAISAYAAVQDPSPDPTSSDISPYQELKEPVMAPALAESAATSQSDPYALERVEQELDQLRKEVGGLRAEILLLREQRERSEAPRKLTEVVAPAYTDAMQMAVQGKTAEDISQRCGITRSEAELVVALVRNSGT
jgi:Protein of unknown function (DUF2802)